MGYVSDREGSRKQNCCIDFSFLFCVYYNSWGIIILRARFYLHWTRERLWEIEDKLRKAPNLEYENDEILLNTLIKLKDRGFRPPPVSWIVPFFIAMVIVAWVLLLRHYVCPITAL